MSQVVKEQSACLEQTSKPGRFRAAFTVAWWQAPSCPTGNVAVEETKEGRALEVERNVSFPSLPRRVTATASSKERRERVGVTRSRGPPGKFEQSSGSEGRNEGMGSVRVSRTSLRLSVAVALSICLAAPY